MRKCGNKCLYRRVLAGALSVLLAVGTGACGGKAESCTGQAEVLTQGAEAGTGSAAQSANGSDIELQQAGSGQSGSAVSAAPVWNDMQPERSMELSYAKQFSVDYYAGGYDLIQVQDDSTYLVVPEGAAGAGGTSGIYYRFAEAAGPCVPGGDIGYGSDCGTGPDGPHYAVGHEGIRLVCGSRKGGHGRRNPRLCGQIQRAGL